MSDLSISFLVDDKKLVGKFMGINSNEGCCRVTRCVDMKAMKLDEKNIARVLPGWIMGVKFFPVGDTRIVAIGNNCENVGFWNIDSDEDNGIYVYHPHSGLVSGISIHPYSLSKALKLDEKNIARVLPGRITEVKFFLAGNTRMLAVGNNCGNVGFWNIDSDEDYGIYVYHPHSGLVSRISIHSYSLSKIMGSMSITLIQALFLEFPFILIPCPRVTRCVDVKALKLDEKNIARVLPRRITEVKFFLAGDTRMLAVGNNCGNVGFWNIDSDEDYGIYVYHPHSGLVSGISIHSYSLSKALKLDEKNIARVLPGRITEVKFFLVGDTRMLAVGNNCGNVGFWNIDSDEDYGIYVYHPHSGLVSGISIHSYSLSKALKLDEKNIARVLPGRITEVKFFLAGDTRMLAVGKNCGNVGFWNIDSDEDYGIYVYHPHSGLVSGISIHSYSLSKALKLDEKNIARVLPGRITEVKFFLAGDTRMLAVGNNCGNVGFWNIDSDEDYGIYVYHPHSGLVSGISIHSYSLSKALKLDEKNIARVLPGRITEVKFFLAGDTRMLAVGNNCGNVGFWNIDSDEDYGIYVYHPHSGLVSGISIHSYSLSKALKLDEKNIARVLPGRITEVKFFLAGDTRMLAVGNNCGNVGFWNIDSDEDYGIYVYHPHSGLVSGISIHSYSLSKALKLDEKNIARVLPGRITEVKLFLVGYTRMLAVGNNCGNVGFWNIDSDEDYEIYVYHPHSGLVSGISIHSYSLSKAMKLDEKNIARVLLGRITEVKFFPVGDTRMLAVGNNYGNVCFWNIDSDEDNGIYVYHPNSCLVSGISIHPYSLYKTMGIKSNKGCCRVTRCVDVEAMKLDQKNIARV
ncbi:hypothetical protein L1987_06548 [Smallanthus sonchifolius]|uniref:Uncharacterized protein n=1 Tax=Smallanthus sonchifolius TaxID=185202 RepID=A0ACB9JYF9_9ASTR|nr:hypothetical protein L1987_06548 [Smallanthus sonchifolius]